jgi:hypothetical protein
MGARNKPTTEIGKAQAAKERALAGLRLIQLVNIGGIGSTAAISGDRKAGQS